MSTSDSYWAQRLSVLEAKRICMAAVIDIWREARRPPADLGMLEDELHSIKLEIEQAKEAYQHALELEHGHTVGEG